jgi:hypothetical protein
MKCSVSLCQMSPRCLVFLGWEPTSSPQWVRKYERLRSIVL